jgi:hypothetical protein
MVKTARSRESAAALAGEISADYRQWVVSFPYPPACRPKTKKNGR